MAFSDRWRYPHCDPSIRLFDLCVQAGWFDSLPEGAHVLELGCCETDFAVWFKQADPSSHLTGVDVNANGDQRYDCILRCPAEEMDTLAWAGTFDAVLALGSIEHFGLGYYGDPVRPDADCVTTEKAGIWLRPGGLFYHDVPWTPEDYYITANRHFRVYDDAALSTRLTPKDTSLLQKAWADGSVIPTALVERPVASMAPFWYCIRLLRKD